MTESRFAPRASCQVDLARLLTEQDTTRTIGHQVELARLQVPASLDKAALWLQQQVFKELQAGEGELRQHDIRDESSSRIQDKEEGLGNAIAWLAARGLPCENLHCLLLAAHEVAFHADSINAFSDAFLVWQLAGPRKSLDFPHTGRSFELATGHAILFDGAAPHGLRLPEMAGQPFAAEEGLYSPPTKAQDISVYLSVDIPWTPEVEALLGVRRTSDEPCCEVLEVDACSGRVMP